MNLFYWSEICLLNNIQILYVLCRYKVLIPYIIHVPTCVVGISLYQLGIYGYLYSAVCYIKNSQLFFTTLISTLIFFVLNEL